MLERLGWTASRTLRASRPRTDEQHVFVGRESELARLDGVLQDSRSQSVAVVVTGATGVGKTTLVRRFLDGLDPHRYVVLATRCHERESISHKVLDGVVDALARYLRKLPPPVAVRLMPRHVRELARLFPALQRVEAVMKAPRSGAASNDRNELRRRAVTALRELLARIADEASLVIWVDDLQWGDVDRMVFIKQVLGAKEAPLGLFIGTYTGRRERLSVPLERIVSGARANGSSIRAERVDVEPLPSADACALAEALLTSDGQSAAADVAREAGGNPLLIRRFALFMVSTGTPVHLRADAFDDMLDSIPLPASEPRRGRSVTRASAAGTFRSTRARARSPRSRCPHLERSGADGLLGRSCRVSP